MAVSVTHTSRSLEAPGRFVWRYTLFGSLVIDEIATALLAATPFNYGFWIRQWDLKSIVEVGGGVWHAEVPYGVGDYPLLSIPSLPSGSSGGTTGGGSGGGAPPTIGDDDPLGREWSWDFGQTTRLMTKSLYSFGGYRANTALESGLYTAIPSTEKGAVIGYDSSNGNVSGAEVPAGVLREEFQFKVPVLTKGYVKKMRDLCSPAHTNSEAFLGSAAGEVKFVGANIQWSQANGFTVKFSFDVGKNQTGIKIGNNLPDASVRAFEYLDVTYTLYINPDGPTGALVKLPERYVVHRVLPEADLNILFS